ncbi:SCP2 sterol-binding domain-containing protein [Virgibacillus soli]
MTLLKDKSISELWDIIDQKLRVNKIPYENVQAIFQFEITDQVQGCYQVIFENGTATVIHGNEKEPDCTLLMKEAFFKKFLTGNVNSATAFMTGKLKVKGNIGTALKLESILKQYSFES